MIVDTSALVAILHNEPEAPAIAEIIGNASICRLSAASYLETGVVIDRGRHAGAGHHLDLLIEKSGIVIEPVTEAQARIARAAYRDFGKGSGHPAQLNFGDCFSYALAREKGEPLLYKGADFGHTGLPTVTAG